MSNDRAVSPVNRSSNHSDDGGIDLTHEDELLLLPVAETPVGRAPSPLLMQRPQSSGIDLGAFSFAKPLPSGKAFSFQSGPRPQQSGPRSNESHVQSGTREDTNPERLMHMSQSKAHPRDGLAQSEISPGATDMKRPEPMTNQSSGRKQPRGKTTVGDKRVSGGEGVDRTPKGRGNDIQSHEPSGYQDARRKRKHNPRESGHTNRPESNVTKPESVSGDPENKRSRITRYRDETEETTRSTDSTLPNYNTERISEDTLFQLLICRMKEREEKEAAAVDLKEQLEAHIAQLAEENITLKKQIEVLVTRLQKKIADSKAYRSQMEGWKARLAGFKCFLNELGSDYKTLRGESFKVSTSKEQLDKEKSEIRVEIAGIKDEIGQACGSIEEMRIGISTSQSVISSLKQELKNREEIVSVLRSQLSDEKIRAKSLESYIRETSRAQSRTLECLQEQQVSLMGKIHDSSKSMSEQLKSTDQSTRLALEDALKQCLASLDHVSREHDQNNIDIHEYKAIVHEIATRSEAASLDLTAEIEAISEANRQLTTEIKHQLQWIDDRLGPDSILHNQLSSSEEKCQSLEERLVVFAPCTERLGATIESLRDGEQALADQIQGLQTKLSEAESSKYNELLSENAVLRAKGDQLAKEIEQTSAEVTATTEALKEKEGEITELKNSLLHAQENAQEANKQLAVSQLEVTQLQEKVRTVEAEVREEVSRASVIARDQHRADFEQKLHELMKEKAEAAMAIEDMDKKLLTSLEELAEAKSLWENRQKAQDIMISESEARAKALTDRFNDITAVLKERDVETKRLRDAELSSTAAKESLQSQLDAANGMISTLTHELSVLSADAQASKDSLEQKVALLQSSVSKKEEECSNLLVELSAANSERSDLEATKTKAKSEIHVLLRRVQDSEGWLRKIRDSLAQLGIMSTEEPLSDVWGKVEFLLHSADVEQPPTEKPTNIENGTLVGPNEDASVSARLPITPKNLCETPGQEVVQTTEVIYRKHVQRSTHASPMKGSAGSGGLGMGSSKLGRPMATQSSANIVPFSSIRRCLSLAPYSSPRRDHKELTDLIIPETGDSSTKEEVIIPCSYQDAPPEYSESPCLGRSVSARIPSSQTVPGEKDMLRTQESKKTENKSETHNNIEHTPSKAKAVTFKAPGSSIRSGKRKAQETGTEADSKRLQKTTPLKPPPRSNQRTYGKVGKSTTQASQTAKDDTIPQGTSTCAQQTNSAESLGSKDKGSRTTPHGQDQGLELTAEYVGRKASPARYASGSSKRTPRGEDQGQSSIASLGPRATRRRSRGDKYNARFNGRG